MAYADRDTTGSRMVAIVVVAIILAAVGYAFVTGLAYKYVKEVSKELNVIDIEEPPPPPPDEPPPPPPDTPMTPPPVVTPPPIVQTNTPPPVVMQSVPTPPPAIIQTPIAAPPAPPQPAPAPPAPRISQAAVARGNPGQYFGPDAYPPAAQRAGAQGRVVARLTVGTDGRVSECSISTSSGNSDLDNTTCRIARSRVRYTPAKDDNGAPIASTQTLPVRWVLPED
jgi:protein TonB